jgi:hypothetical protein
VNYADPFGLCVEDDINCKYLVAALRSHGGSEFGRAADAYDALKVGRVFFIAKSQLGPINRANDVRGLAPVGRDDNVWLVGESTRADFLVNAVHEAAHLRGIADNTQELVQTVYDAYMQLSPEERAEAAWVAQWLYDRTDGQVGKDTKRQENEK